MEETRSLGARFSLEREDWTYNWNQRGLVVVMLVGGAEKFLPPGDEIEPVEGLLLKQFRG